MFRSSPLDSRLLTPGRSLLTAGLLLVVIATARGEVAWHADLDAARTASAASGKPVLAIFQASWDAAASDPTTDVLANPEVEAVVVACFEAVRLDVDEHADLARQLAVEHVPAARVLDRDAVLLASFDCPGTPSEFVAAAARAAQVAAAGSSAGATASTAVTTDAFSGSGKTEHETALAVSAKVRQLSSFAEGQPAHPAADRGDLATAPQASPPIDVGSRYSEAPAAPTLATAPPPWRTAQTTTAPPASTAPATTAPTPTQPASLEPRPSAPASWLAGSQPALPPTAAQPVPPSGPAASDPRAAAGATATPPAAKPQSGFWAAMQKPWSIFSKSSSKPTAEAPSLPPTMPPARPQLPAALARIEPVADQHGPMPLGLEGYCPVTVVERGSWVEGRPQWGARHRGRTYLFAGPEQQQAFLADPDRYAPALSGDDPVLAFEHGRCEPGRRTYGVSYQSRMYLFSSPETRAAFSADPDRYTTRVLIAEGTAPADGIRRF